MAEDEITAQRAVRLIEVEYEEYPVEIHPRKSMLGTNPPVHEEKKDNILVSSNYSIGDVERGLEQAATVLKRSYKTPIVQHCHIENPISYAYMENGRIVVVSSTQIPHIVRRVIGQALGIPWGKIRVIKPYIGGGFGNKQDVLYEPLNAFLTMQVGGRPVKLDVSREETFCNTRTRHSIEYDLTAGVDKDGSSCKRHGSNLQPGSICFSRTCDRGQWTDFLETAVCLPEYQWKGVYGIYQYTGRRSYAWIWNSAGMFWH